MPVIRDGEAPWYADANEAKAIVGAIMGRYNQIRSLEMGKARA